MRARLIPFAAALLLLAGPAAGPAAAQSGASVTFDAQTSDGLDVTVDEVTLPDGGFVAIHDASLTEGNVLGSVVGVTQKLDAGNHQDVTAHLFDHVDEDQTLVAMPHKDTNGDATYNFVSDNGNTDGPYTKGGGAVTDSAEVTVSATVTMEDQDSEGTTLLIDRVSMEDGGFVAIHDDRLLEGMPVASVVGSSSFLESGVHEDVRVSLDQELTENQTLISMPHRDSDGDGSYDFVESGGQDDPPYTNHTDKAVIDSASVTITDTANATFADQTTGGHVVDVGKAFLPDGGFVTIHDSSLLDGKPFDSVRGTSAYLEPGLHGSVEVVLSDPLASDDTLYAMPHRDTNDNEAYDFVNSDGAEDGPYTEDGEAVVDPGEATLSASAVQMRQDSDSTSVVVDRVDLSDGGFVTIHDASLFAGAVFDSVVGVSAPLDAGVHRDVEVNFDDPVRDSQPLVAMPHKDTNDNDAYDFVTSDGSEDGPYATSQGSPVVAPGFTEIQSSVTADDQTTDGSQASVAVATLSDGGFVTIHDDSLLDGKPFESVVGVSDPLDPGTASDVTVPFDEELTADQTLYAMPHYDSDGDGTYDFVTSQGQDDGPYTAQGGAVIDAFALTVTGSSTSPDGGDGGTGNGLPGPGLAALVAVLGVTALAHGRRD